MAAQILTTTQHCLPRHPTQVVQTEASGELAFILCVYLPDVMPLSWMSLNEDHGCCHCLLNIDTWSEQRVQTAV